MLLNLLSNAIKYNREDGSVTIDVEKTSDDTLRIAISDTGPGIEKEKYDSLFEPFDRLGKEASAIKGAGIGLSIVKELIKSLDGQVGFHSEIGQGSTFWIELPLAENDMLPSLDKPLRDDIDASNVLKFAEDR